MSTHNHHSHGSPNLTTAFRLAILLNVTYVIVEGIFGFVSDSMGLLSDAGHNLSDVASLLISFIAIKAMARKPNDAFTYGFRKSTVVASVVNAVILYVAVIMILIESIDKLTHPVEVEGITVAWVAGVGVLINGVTAWMFMKDSKRDLNVKGAFLHMVSDTLVSVGVVAAGIVISITNWTYIDPIIGICIAILIAVSSWSLLRESLRMAFDGTPSSVDINKVRAAIMEVAEVKAMHHLHIWSISTTDTAMTVHVLVDNPDMIDRAIIDVRNAVKDLGINHSTIEAETSETDGCNSDF